MRRITSWITLAALLLATTPLLAAPAAARIEGLLVHEDGSRAAGWSAVLVSEDGERLAEAAVGDDGTYSLRDVAAGRYALALRTPAGTYAPVAAPAFPVREGELLRRDVALQQVPGSSAGAVDDAANYGLRIWWVGLSKKAKAWTTTGLIVGTGVLAWVLLDDDDPETTASPMTLGK